MNTLQKQSLFWDVRSVDPVKNSDFVIERILNFGDIDDFKWAIKFYGKDKMKRGAENSRELDSKSLSFWCRYFNIDKSICIQKQLKAKQSAFWRR